MELTQFTDYSLRVLIYLAIHPEKLITIDEIAEHFRISRNHLVKVVHALSRKGLIKSYRGKNGGLRLSSPPESYRLGELIKSTEPHIDLLECFDLKTNTCPIAGACKLEAVLYQARDAFFATLDQYTLADMMGKDRQRSALITRLGLSRKG